jgi:hypothetical protein
VAGSRVLVGLAVVGAAVGSRVSAGADVVGSDVSVGAVVVDVAVGSDVIARLAVVGDELCCGVSDRFYWWLRCDRRFRRWTLGYWLCRHFRRRFRYHRWLCRHYRWLSRD